MKRIKPRLPVCDPDTSEYWDQPVLRGSGWFLHYRHQSPRKDQEQQRLSPSLKTWTPHEDANLLTRFFYFVRMWP